MIFPRNLRLLRCSCRNRNSRNNLGLVVSNCRVKIKIPRTQELLKKADFAETVAAIHRGMKAHARGEGKNMRKAVEDIAKEAGFELQ